MEHHMTATGVFFVLALAITIDALRVGPNAISDRVAWFFAVPGIYEGFNGSFVDQWTIGNVGAFIDWAKAHSGGAYIAGASTQAILGMVVLVVIILTIGVLLPMKASAKLGKFATYTFAMKKETRINYKLWGSAAIIGLFCDLPMGNFGDFVKGTVVWMSSVVAYVPNNVMGYIQ